MYATQLPVVIGELGVGIRRPVDFQYEGCTNGENNAEEDIDCNHNPDPLLRHYQDRLQQFQTMQQQSVTMMNRMMMSDDGTTNDTARYVWYERNFTCTLLVSFLITRRLHSHTKNVMQIPT
mmetsp:Transcript_39552/g.40021  ORF Transcript_39552/g.40021 Transcript_39552/m.40021 type:complete len:121 (-) Transcript_39552:23-385(-)